MSLFKSTKTFKLTYRLEIPMAVITQAEMDTLAATIAQNTASFQATIAAVPAAPDDTALKAAVDAQTAAAAG